MRVMNNYYEGGNRKVVYEGSTGMKFHFHLVEIIY